MNGGHSFIRRPRESRRFPEGFDAVLLAIGAYAALGLRGYARVDFRLDAQHRPFILEANPNPDSSQSAGLARAWMVSGRSYEDFWMTQLAAALRDRRN